MSGRRGTIAALLAVALAVGCLLAVRQHESSGFFQGSAGEYECSFYNRVGQSVSERNGTLKMVMDPFTVYANYPNQVSSSYTIDSHGFRGGCGDGRKETVMLVGGSAAFGVGLASDGETLAACLSRLSPRYEFINAAVVGYLSGQELAQMVHYLDDFHPKLYVVFDGFNDICGPYQYRKIESRYRPPIGFNQAYTMIEMRMAQYARLRLANRRRLEETDKDLSDSEMLACITQQYISNVLKMRGFARAQGAEFLLVFQPELGNKNRQTAVEVQLSGDKLLHRQYKRLVREAKSRFSEVGVPYLDMNEQPEITENPETLYFDLVHPNARGQAVIAGIINRAIRR